MFQHNLADMRNPHTPMLRRPGSWTRALHPTEHGRLVHQAKNVLEWSSSPAKWMVLTTVSRAAVKSPHFTNFICRGINWGSNMHYTDSCTGQTHSLTGLWVTLWSTHTANISSYWSSIYLFITSSLPPGTRPSYPPPPCQVMAPPIPYPLKGPAPPTFHPIAF